MGIFTTAVIVTVIGIIVLAGIIYLTIEIDKKITVGRLKKIIRNEKRFDDVAMCTVHSKQGKTVKVDILKADGEKFAELTVTGKSTALTLREGRKIKISG